MLQERIPGMDVLRGMYSRIRVAENDTSIGGRLLQELKVTYRVSPQDLQNIPSMGPTVMVLNHPMGLLEGAVLMEILREVRSDVKFLANSVLASVPELAEHIIPVDVMGNAIRDNVSGMRKAAEHIANGGMLVIFPAGEVSHFQFSKLTVADGDWHPSIARLISLTERRRTGVKLVPAFVSGANSVLFQCAGMLHGGLRTLLLVRELLNKKNSLVEIRIGSCIAAQRLEQIANDAERMEYLRWRCELLSNRNTFKARTRFPLTQRNRAGLTPVAPAVDPALLTSEVEALPAECRLTGSGPLSAYLAPASAIPNVLLEIGRLREIAFRDAGEGSGKARDLDVFDPDYLHLFVWNAATGEIAGAYRLAPTDLTGSLYTSTLFRYGPEFLQRMGPALELGRSFVRLEYQKSFAPLLLLWKGIAKYVALHPRYKVLFGPVSISNRYHALSRELMVGFLEKYAQLTDWKRLVETRNPFRSKHATPQAFFRACADVDELAGVVSDIEASPEGVPVLLRQYLKLGGKLLGFNVDPEFSDVVDGLIVVDLTRTETRLLERYLGREEARQFLQFHEGR